MRKIETLMNRAILNRTDWTCDNTRVEYEEGNQVSRVYLYNRKIAEIGENFITLYDGDYQSNTTKSRLNALLQEHGADDKVFQKNFQWFLYNGQTQETQEFVSGVTLGQLAQGASGF